MTRTPSPLNLRVEVRFVGDRELDAMIESLVEPGRDSVTQSKELRRAIRDQLTLGVDEVRIRASMQRVLEQCSRIGAMRCGFAFGRLRQGLTGHQRLRITHARLEDETAAALSRPVPIPAPAEPFSDLLARLL